MDEFNLTIDCENIDTIPDRIKTDTGYEYPTEFRNRLFKNNNNYIYFRKSSTFEIPCDIIDSLMKIIFNMIVDKIKDQIVDAIDMAEADKKSIRTQLEDSKNALESFNIKINMINTKYEELVKIPENVNHQLKQLLEEISEFIDKKITDKMSALNVVNEKSDNENTSKKLKLTDLLVLKENFDPKDLIEFRKVGMI
jgi:hypothetical protein